MSSLREKIIARINELGDKAPEYFDKPANVLHRIVKHSERGIPFDVVEKALALDKQEKTASQVVAETQAAPNAAPALPGAPSTLPAVIGAPWGLQQAFDEIRALDKNINAIANHIIQIMQPEHAKLKTDLDNTITNLTNLAGTMRELSHWKASFMYPSPVPTVGQMMDVPYPQQPAGVPIIKGVDIARPGDIPIVSPEDLPSRLNPAARATVLETYNGHPLDTGIAPTQAQREAGLAGRAEGINPNNPPRSPGPADGRLQRSEPGATGWTHPWPAKR